MAPSKDTDDSKNEPEDELSLEIKPAGWKEDTKSNLTFTWISEICEFIDFPKFLKE